MDEALEDAYQSYLKRKGKREELETAKHDAAVAKRARLGKGGDLSGDASGEEQETDTPATFATAPEPAEEDEEVLHRTDPVPAQQSWSLSSISCRHCHKADHDRRRITARCSLLPLSPFSIDGCSELGLNDKLSSDSHMAKDPGGDLYSGVLGTDGGGRRAAGQAGRTPGGGAAHSGRGGGTLVLAGHLQRPRPDRGRRG